MPRAAADQGKGSLPHFGLRSQDTGTRRRPGPGLPALCSGPLRGCARSPGSAGAAGTGGSGWAAALPGWPAPSSFAVSLAQPEGCPPPGPGCSWAEVLGREIERSDRDCLPLGNEEGKGWGAVLWSLGSGVKAAEPWSPSGGPRSNRGRKSLGAQGDRPGQAAPAAGRRRRS